MASPSTSPTAALTQPASTINLSKVETRRLVQDIWLVQALLMLAMLMGAYALWQWTELGLMRANGQTTTLSSDLQTHQEKLNKVSQEEQEIIQKTKLFQAWQARKVAAAVNELDIQEFLYALAKHHGIGEFEYHNQENAMRQESIGNMINRSPPNNKNESEDNYLPLKVNVMTQQMSFKIQHEKQLFDFLADISNIPELRHNTTTKPPPAFARLSPCKISRISQNAPLSPTQVNFLAQCKIEWINFIPSTP